MYFIINSAFYSLFLIFCYDIKNKFTKWNTMNIKLITREAYNAQNNIVVEFMTTEN